MRLIARLLDWLNYDNGSDRQLLFTARSPAALDGLNLSDPEIRLFVVECNSDGQTCVRRLIPTPELAKLNQQYPLSRLWPMGHLGAVPNL